MGARQGVIVELGRHGKTSTVREEGARRRTGYTGTRATQSQAKRLRCNRYTSEATLSLAKKLVSIDGPYALGCESDLMSCLHECMHACFLLDSHGRKARVTEVPSARLQPTDTKDASARRVKHLGPPTPYRSRHQASHTAPHNDSTKVLLNLRSSSSLCA